ncbi:MAG TPA: membrane protein insertase YidC [Xanthobacteraceae bacterium]|jgi:YidC/Oxa1 family membrane protein insertase
MDDNKNTILAILLSVIVLVAWQYFVGIPQMEKQREQTQRTQQQTPGQTPAPAPGQPAATPGAAPVPGQPPRPGTTAQPTPGAPTAAAPAITTREAALAASPRIAIETPRMRGSISLRGARIDDVSLTQYRETVDPKSPIIVLLSPSGSPHPFYAEFGWVGAPGATSKLPGPDTLWTAATSGPLAPDRPVKLSWDNGEGLVFTRTIAVDRDYLFTVADEVENKAANPVTLFNYGLVSRHGTPVTLGYYILHEGLIGVLGDGKLHEIVYTDIEKKTPQTVKSEGGWLGITDKYWAATLLPNPKINLQARFSYTALGNVKTYQADFLADQATVAPGAKLSAQSHLFAGAKELDIIDRYESTLGVKRFDLLIDWGWFYFITKPMFQALDFFYKLTGNFGLAILLVTLIIKIVFLPLANKSYASMAKMKKVQPQMEAIRARLADDKVKQQQALMELYKQEKINPLAGCLPILVQIPVFFALYKVLFVSIDLRQAPFFGWIRDLSAPDPTNLFNLFGLIPFDPTLIPVLGQFLHIGIWPLVMGVTMWVQMKLNPSPPDPTQKMIFDWMPLIFTFMLASFSAGLVIYWAWNNTLSVLQQSFIMRRNGAKIELWDNLKETLGLKKKPST